MGRVFTKNLSNFVSLGLNTLNPRSAGATRISSACWFYAVGFTTGATDNVPFAEFISGASLGYGPVVGGVTPKLGYRGRSVSTDALQVATGVTTITTNRWWHGGGTKDYVAKTMQVWLNGALETTTSPTWANTSYTAGSPTAIDVIGCTSSAGVPGSTAVQWNGWLADVAIWRTKLSVDDWDNLAEGASPLTVQPNSLLAFWPLDDTGNNIRDRGTIGIQAKVTGSIPVAPDPPRAGRFRRRRVQVGFVATAPSTVWCSVP